MARFLIAATSGAQLGMPDVCRRKSGEAPGDYRNRIAKEIFAGTWETVTDHSDLVKPDGTRYGIDKQRMLLTFRPSESDHGFFKVMSSTDGGAFTSGGCYKWKLMTVESRFLLGTVASFWYYPSDCPDAVEPAYGTPEYELWELRRKSDRAKQRPVYRFVMKDKDTLIQKDATPFEGPHISFGDQVWRRVK